MRDKAFKIAIYPKNDGYERELASMVYKLFDKKSSGSGVETEADYQLGNELHKQIIRKLRRWKVYSSFKDNTWGADIAEIVRKIQQRNQVIVCNRFV